MAERTGRSGIAGAILVGMGLLLATCVPGRREQVPTGPAAPPGSVRFTAQGDIGLGDGAQKVLDVIKGLGPQLNIALGDLSYEPGLEEQFCNMVTGTLGADLLYQLITGNHESDGRDGDIEKFVRCLPNKLPGLQGTYGTQWYVDVPQQDPIVRFVMVSPGIDFRDGQPLDYSKDSERWDWTVNAIEGAEAADIPWTVVGMHAPCLSMGKYKCQPGQEFTNMLVDKKVDLVLSGHEHSYQRTDQLRTGRECPAIVPESFSRPCVADTDNSLAKGDGTLFATAGVGGAGLYDINDEDPEAGYFAAASGKNRDPAEGTLDAIATKERLTVRFVPAEGYSFTDAFTIERK